MLQCCRAYPADKHRKWAHWYVTIYIIFLLSFVKTNLKIYLAGCLFSQKQITSPDQIFGLRAPKSISDSTAHIEPHQNTNKQTHTYITSSQRKMSVLQDFFSVSSLIHQI